MNVNIINEAIEGLEKLREMIVTNSIKGYNNNIDKKGKRIC